MTAEAEAALSSFERELCSADIPSWRKEELLEHVKVARTFPLDLTHLVAIYEALRQAKISLDLAGSTQDEDIRSIERHWADCFVWRCQLGTEFGDRKAFYATVNQAFLGYTTEESLIAKVGQAYVHCIGKVFKKKMFKSGNQCNKKYYKVPPVAGGGRSKSRERSEESDQKRSKSRGRSASVAAIEDSRTRDCSDQNRSGPRWRSTTEASNEEATWKEYHSRSASCSRVRFTDAARSSPIVLPVPNGSESLELYVEAEDITHMWPLLNHRMTSHHVANGVSSRWGRTID